MEWLPIRDAPKDRQVLLWFEAVAPAKQGKVRVGFWRESTKYEATGWLVFTAGGLLIMPVEPALWAMIVVPG